MFGYVTICEPEIKMKDYRKYKAYYCGLCRTLKEKHGSLGQITLSYDMTFARCGWLVRMSILIKDCGSRY